MSEWLADLLYRWRVPLSAAIIAGALALAPRITITQVNNDLTAWFSPSDPVYQEYERFRDEFGGTQSLIVALRSEDATARQTADAGIFTAERLAFLQRIVGEIERVPTVQRVQSLATTSLVRTVRPPAGTSAEEIDGGLEIAPLLDAARRGPDESRELALRDRLIAGELVARDGRTTAIVVTFDENEIKAVRRQVLDQIHAIVENGLPIGLRAYYNGSIEISETYNRITRTNNRRFLPLALALTLLAMYALLRSVGRTVVTLFSILVSVVWTLGLYATMGFNFSILTAMLTPLVVVLAISDDVHMIQHYDYHRRRASAAQAFKETVSYLLSPLFGASATTALGLLALATSDVITVREFGIGAAVGVMVDFVISIVLVPTLLGLLGPERRLLPHELHMIEVLRRAAGFATVRPHAVIAAFLLIVGVAAVGIAQLQIDTNHINFFGRAHPLKKSASVIDGELAGISSFHVLLTGPADSMKAPDVVARMAELSGQIGSLQNVRKVVSLADYVTRTHQALHEDDPAAAAIPEDASVIAQELFLFAMTEEGRRELQRVASSDFSKAHITVRFPSTNSTLVLEQIERVERLATDAFTGSPIRATVTGTERLFATLDNFLVRSQISSFGTAFVTVFATFFLLFRSFRFGLLAVVPNLFPVIVGIGVMGWLGISINVATVMVASVALGIVDDDTVHFINRFRHQLATGATEDEAIGLAAVIEGRAALTIALINTCGFSVLVFSEYRPSAWFGGLLALTMMVALLSEVLLLPAMVKLLSRFFGGKYAEPAQKVHRDSWSA